MKFGKRLRRECHVEWESYYLDYKELKKIIKTIVATSSGTYLIILFVYLKIYYRAWSPREIHYFFFETMKSVYCLIVDYWMFRLQTFLWYAGIRVGEIERFLLW